MTTRDATGAAVAAVLLASLACAQSGVPLTFTGSSFVQLTDQAVNLRGLTGLSFRSCEYGTLLEQHVQADSLELGLLENGTLRLIVRAGGATDWESAAGAGLNDNRWHRVALQFRLGRLTLEVDGREEALVASEKPPLREQVLTAALAPSELLVGRNFKGCLLRGPGVPLDDPAARAINVQRGLCTLPDTDTCDGYRAGEPSPCFSQPCHHGRPCSPLGDADYTCACTRRYAGKDCELDNGPLCSLAEFQCQNGGICQEDWTGDRAVCLCPEGFSGAQCEVTVQACIANPCHNNGRCSMTNGVQTCACPIGFTGTYCATPVDDCAALDPPCLHEGECIDTDNDFLCDCRGTGYEGKRCENNIDECQSAPCQNGATCFDQYPDYMCACPPGWEGRHCEQDINECSIRPCENGGKCANFPGGFRCACRAGFTGDHCSTNIDDCTTAQCPENSECVDGVKGHECVCLEGFAGPSSNCTRMLSCEPNPCQNGGLCQMAQQGAVCYCTDGFTGPACEGVLTVPEPLLEEFGQQSFSEALQVETRQESAPCDSAPCLNGATCLDEPNGIFSCICAGGFSGEQCEIGAVCRPDSCRNGGVCTESNGAPVCTCLDGFSGEFCEASDDPCQSQPCMNEADCVVTETEQSYYCECRDGFEGLTCEHNIDDCRGISCPPGQQCVDQVAGYQCLCPDGFSGEQCDVNINDCADNPCQNNGTCVDSVNTYQCICPPGYTGRNCTDDLDECEVNNPCIHGICQNKVGSYQCYCLPGFYGNHCNLDYDECLSRPCLNNGSCENLVNGYSCNCAPGFTGKNCEENINECEPYPCSNNATCIDGIAMFECACLPGFTGELCETNIDECESAPCLNNGSCIDGINEFRCDCADTGFTGATCEVNIDDCEPQPCQHGSACVDLVKDFRCECHSGFEGKNCETDVAECELLPCQNGATCVEKSNRTLYELGGIPGLPDVYNHSTAGGYLCLCLPGFEGADCEIDIDECASSPCLNGDCIDGVATYTCQCWPGYEGDHCQTEIDECQRLQPCVHGACVDQVADYQCQCDDGYGGKNCSVELLGCVGVTCLHGGTCRPYVVDEVDHRFRCQCPPGHCGDLCQNETTASFTGSSHIQVVAEPAGPPADNYTLSLRFRTTLPDGLLALGQGRSGTGDTFFRLRLNSGTVNLYGSMQNALQGLSVGSDLHDAAWHGVTLSINGTTVALSVDGSGASEPLRVSSSEDTRFERTLLGHAAVSQLQPFLNTSGFVGCMQDIVVDGKTVIPSELVDEQAANITLGCPREEQCAPNPCLNGGACVDLWSQHRCECSRPFLGELCAQNITAATFNHEDSANSLVSVSVDPAFADTLSSYLDLSLFARTRQPAGLVFYLGSDVRDVLSEGGISYVAAELREGQLELRLKLSGDQEEMYLVPGPRLDDGVNNLIRVVRNGSELNVLVNGELRLNETVSGTDPLRSEVLYLGDMPEPGRRRKRQVDERGVNPAFKGSIQDVRIVNGAGRARLVEFFPLEDEALRLPPPLGIVSLEAVLPGSVSDDTCRQQPCENGGVCSVTWNDFSCDCPRGYKGHTCTELEYCVWHECPSGSTCRDLVDGHECIANATFNGVNSSVAFVSQLGGQAALVSLSALFRSRAGGLLLSVGAGEMTLAVSDQGARMVWPGGDVVVAMEEDLLSGEWRQLELEWDETELRTTVDGGQLAPVPLPAPLSVAELLNVGEVRLGAAPAVALAPFRGCLSEVRLGGLLLPFVSDAEVNSTASSRFIVREPLEFVTADCTLCYQQECQNGGQCAAPAQQFDCSCPAGFNGTLCQHNIDECLLGHDCTNGATCVDGVDGYSCACVPGYVGLRCETEIDECASFPCQHESTCIDAINNYTCVCTEEYTGRDCEQMKVVNCTHAPCQNGGQCENQYSPGSEVADNYTCSCPHGYEGRDCELVVDFCLSMPCQHGGQCQSIPGVGYSCICLPGFEGTDCEIDIDECASSPCLHGGTCIDQVNMFVCQCSQGWTGPVCDSDIPECNFSPCENGNCTELPGSFLCTCEEEFCGITCQLDNHCYARADMCQNGGSCQPLCDGDPSNYGFDNATCMCVDGYYGPHCENKSRTAEIVMVVAPVLSILLLASIVGMVIFTTMAKNKRATRGTYSPSRQEMFNPRVEMGNMKKPPPEERLI